MEETPFKLMLPIESKLERSVASLEKAIGGSTPASASTEKAIGGSTPATTEKAIGGSTPASASTEKTIGGSTPACSPPQSSESREDLVRRRFAKALQEQKKIAFADLIWLQENRVPMSYAGQIRSDIRRVDQERIDIMNSRSSCGLEIKSEWQEVMDRAEKAAQTDEEHKDEKFEKIFTWDRKEKADEQKKPPIHRN